MKKFSLLLILVTITSVLFYFKINAQVTEPLPTQSLKPISSIEKGKTGSTDLSGGKGPLAGFIINKKATKIQTLEAAGYICPVIGQTIEIKKSNEKYKFPTSYFIASFVKSKNPTGTGKAILGYYAGTTTITCTHPIGSVETVILSNIVKYGVSKGAVEISKLSNI